MIGFVEVPLPLLGGDHAGVVAGDAVHGPVGGDDVGVVIGAVDGAGSLLVVPTRPGAPVALVIFEIREARGVIIEEALFHAVHLRAFADLEAAPESLVDELSVLIDFGLVGLAEFLHGVDLGIARIFVAEQMLDRSRQTHVSLHFARRLLQSGKNALRNLDGHCHRTPFYQPF